MFIPICDPSPFVPGQALLDSPGSDPSVSDIIHPHHHMRRSFSDKHVVRQDRVIPVRSVDSMPSINCDYGYSRGYVEAKNISPVITNTAPRLQKRIIVCCDGTWNNGLSTNPRHITNVSKLARCIFPEDRRTFPPIPQLVFYQAGLGTTDLLALNLAEGATGTGISAKIREAYAFIAQNYIPGDEVFLFGFSRGAFTARTIASLIADIGILTTAGMEDFYQVLAAYQVRGEGSEKSEKAESFLNNYRRGGPKRMREMPPGTLKCVGVWDTVGALGIPPLFGANFNLLGFRDTKLSHHIKYAFHAIAIHETRKEFMPTKWRKHLPPPGAHDSQVLKQVWFSGSHSDVGGGNKNHDLSDVTLIWMVANLIEYKLLSIDEEYLLTLPAPTLDWGKQQPTDPRTGVMTLTAETVRDLPTTYDATTRETVHRSVESQVTSDAAVGKIFKSKDPRLIEELLPFEIKMRGKWDVFLARTNDILQAEAEGHCSSEVEHTLGGRRTLFRDLLRTMVGILGIGIDTLTKLRGREDDEELAYKTLETPT